VWNSSYSIVGSVDDDGRIWNSSYSVVGSVDSDGRVWNSSYSIVGSIDGASSLRQAGGAALLLLLG
jgi:hypothetical protein